MQRVLKAHVPDGTAVSSTAAVYSAAVLNYICGETLELAGNAAKDLKSESIEPRHLQLAVRGDEELNALIQASLGSERM